MKLFVIKSTVFSMILGVVMIVTYSIIRAWNWLQATDGDTLNAAKWNELVNSSSTTPRWFVWAFNWATCPSGWNPADGIDDPAVWWWTNPIDARWQFLRWLNSFDNWATIRSDWKQDPDWAGRIFWDYQWDELKGHTHTIYYYETSDWANDATWYFDSSTSSQWIKYQTTSSFWWSETRSKNVGVIYCIKE